MTKQKTSMVVPILLLNIFLLSSCGETPTPSATSQQVKTNIIRPSDYQVGIKAEQQTYAIGGKSSFDVKLVTNKADSNNPFNGTMLFLKVPNFLSISKVSKSDTTLKMIADFSDKKENVFLVLFAGGEIIQDRDFGIITFDVTGEIPAGKQVIQIINDPADNAEFKSKLSGFLAGQKAHDIGPADLCTITP